MSQAVISVPVGAPYVQCVFDLLFGEGRHQPLQGSGELLEGGDPFKVVLIRQRGVLKVLLPDGRDLKEDMALVFPFDPGATHVCDWAHRPSFEGTMGTLRVMGEIVAVNERFTLMVVHSFSRAGVDVPLRDDSICLIVPTARTDALTCIDGESDE